MDMDIQSEVLAQGLQLRALFRACIQPCAFTKMR